VSRCPPALRGVRVDDAGAVGSISCPPRSCYATIFHQFYSIDGEFFIAHLRTLYGFVLGHVNRKMRTRHPIEWSASADYTVTASSGLGSITTTLNLGVRPAVCNGTMVFGPTAPIYVSEAQAALATADLNGDGKTDLAVTRYRGASIGVPLINVVTVLLNTGSDRDESREQGPRISHRPHPLRLDAGRET